MLTCFPWLTVHRNVEFGACACAAMRRKRGDARVMELLHLVGLSGVGEQVSGATLRRHAAAGGYRPPRLGTRFRAFCSWTSPSAALDAQLRRRMQAELVQIRAVTGQNHHLRDPRYRRERAARRPNRRAHHCPPARSRKSCPSISSTRASAIAGRLRLGIRIGAIAMSPATPADTGAVSQNTFCWPPGEDESAPGKKTESRSRSLPVRHVHHSPVHCRLVCGSRAGHDQPYPAAVAGERC